MNYVGGCLRHVVLEAEGPLGNAKISAGLQDCWSKMYNCLTRICLVAASLIVGTF